MEKVTILNKEFKLFLSSEKIQETVLDLSKRLNEDLKDKEVIFLAILNGSFMFASDLFKQIEFNSKITFLKLASYSGTSSTGKIKRLIGLNEMIEGKTLVVLEDIVDTGITLDHIIKQLRGYEPKEIKIASLLFKPDAYKKQIHIDYVGLEIPNNFIVGYGLDYEGFGRNLQAIYTEI